MTTDTLGLDTPEFDYDQAEAYCRSPHITRRVLQSAVQRGQLGCYRIGRKALFSRNQLDAWLASRQQVKA